MLHKYDICAALGKKLGLDSYLEIATSTTGHEFHFVDLSQFKICDRALYYCPEGWSDGLPVMYRTVKPTSREIMPKITEKYGIVFVDTWHEYWNVVDDIELALSTLQPDGLVVLHDCSPPNAIYAAPKLPPECKPGYCDRPWSGMTYAAYLDKVVGSSEVTYATVDADHGIGIISKNHRLFRGPRPSYDLVMSWRAARGAEPMDRYYLFDCYRTQLLRLQSLDDVLGQL